ncbi:MAG: HAD-IIIA family hydrolase [Nanoarchaeota archaeon]|nr:HAD-IIIA family hydrolase [Nanoarchaeota archaeon]
MIISADDLQRIREKHIGQKIVYCSGSFDLVHAGHILFFEDCKKYGDILVVSVGKDSSIRKNKGEGRPILNERVRLKTIDSLKPVDYAFINPVSVEGKQLNTLELALDNLKPDFYIINEDAFDTKTRIELAKKFGVELVILNRNCPPEFENISATKIIEKIKNLPDKIKSSMKKAIFLDRDGVINDDEKDEFIYKKDDIFVRTSSKESLRKMKDKGYLLICITNQPLIARGLASEKEVEEINNLINQKIGNLIDRFYICPHHPEMHPDVPEHAKKYRIVCNCRKPSPGMLITAAKDFDIDLKKSWMIGDMITDIIAGKSTGCKTILIKSKSNSRLIKSAMPFDINTKPDFYADNLSDAIKLLDISA